MDINDLSKSIDKIGAKIDTIHGEVTALKISLAERSSALDYLRKDLASEKVKTSNNTAGYLAIKETLVDSLAKSIRDIDNHKEAMDEKHELLREKIDSIQKGQIKLASIVAGISAGIGAGAAGVLHKFPSLSKLFD